MLDIITQTNRTMLFEEINPQKLDLIAMVGETKGVDSLSDDKIKEIDEALAVHSLEEFLDKFQPVVYSFFNAETQTVLYTLKKPESIPESLITEIPLNLQNDFLNMLISLVNIKRAQGIANVDFKFEKITDMISPRKVMDDILQSRKEIHYVYGKYELLEEGDPAKLDLADRLNVLFEEASENYNNVMAMLPLALEDIKTRLLLGAGGNLDDAKPLRIGKLSMGDKGELKVIEAPKEETKALALSEGVDEKGLALTFAEDYEAVNEEPTDYIKSLVVRTFCPLMATAGTELDVATEVANYNSYLDFYRRAKDDFIKAVKPLIEKVLGVKMFFDQYDVKNRSMVPTMLVTNCKPEMLSKSMNLPCLEIYLNTVNQKNDFDHTVWFGIMPNIELDPVARRKLKRERFKGNEVIERDDLNTMEALTMMLDTVKHYKVQMFFSFEGGERTTFNTIAQKGLESLMDKCQPLIRRDYSEFAVPSLPNFTIIPKDKSGVILDKKLAVNESGGVAQLTDKENIAKLWIEGVYVGASFVAAGIMAACQCPEFLKQRFRNINMDYPGVRFDIEAKDYALRAPTTMAKEISGYTTNIKDKINRNNFGFVFSSETSKQGGKNVTRITVYKARSLEVLYEGGFESCFKTHHSTYIERMLRFQSHDFKQDSVVHFFSNDPTSQKSQWLAKRGFVNSVVQEGDDLTYSIDERSNSCTIHVTYNGNIRNLDVEIKRSVIAV